MSNKVAYINHDQLAELVRNRKAGKDYQVVDVRDDDFHGGNIPGAIHAPSEESTEQSIADLTRELKGVPKVIFHCALSQSRGPYAARQYAQALASSLEANKDQGKSEQEVLILRNGFKGWSSYYKDDPVLVENFDKSQWSAHHQFDSRWRGN